MPFRCGLHFFSVGFLELITYTPSVTSHIYADLKAHSPLTEGEVGHFEDTAPNDASSFLFKPSTEDMHHFLGCLPHNKKRGKQNFHYETMALLYIEYVSPKSCFLKPQNVTYLK